MLSGFFGAVEDTPVSPAKAVVVAISSDGLADVATAEDGQ
jgi:hypothetical protein